MDNSKPQVVFTLHPDEYKSDLEIKYPTIAEFTTRWWKGETSGDWRHARSVLHGMSLMTPCNEPEVESELVMLRDLAVDHAFDAIQEEFSS